MAMIVNGLLPSAPNNESVEVQGYFFSLTGNLVKQNKNKCDGVLLKGESLGILTQELRVLKLRKLNKMS